MNEYVNHDVLANWVSMLRADTEGAIWLSDNNAESLFYERCASQLAKIVPATDGALRLLDMIEARGVQGVVATTRQASLESLRSNIFCPSLGDVASLLLMSKCVEAVILDVAGTAWVRSCEKEIGQPHARAIELAGQLSELRSRFDSDAQDFLATANICCNAMHWTTFELNWSAISAAIGDCPTIHGSPRDLTREDLKARLRITDGMNALEVLSSALANYRPRGVAAQTSATAGELMRMLRIAFEIEELSSDEVFWKMRQWERSNPRYPLLRSFRVRDPLDVLLDQRYWERDLDWMLARAEMGAPLVIFKLDLDNFKRVNDTLGHAAGDEAIRLYGRLVSQVLGRYGEVYRRGGDEVVALALDLDVAEAQNAAEALRRLIEHEFRIWAGDQGLDIGPTASIGLVAYERGEHRDQLIARIDRAQHEAKARGKNQVVFGLGGDQLSN